jgi:cytochrome c oxidase subunit II
MPSTLHAYDHVAGIFFPIAIAVFACVVIILGVLLALGARRRAPSRRSEANRLETVYAIVLGATVGVLVWITFTAETPIDRLVTRPGLAVKVVAAQWSWTFRYANGTTVSAVASWSPAVALVPSGVEVQFDATSRDVIHGFWIPGLHYLRQVIPGYTTRFDLLFAKPGRYQGECAVFCGLLHPQMHFEIQAVSPARFRSWLASGGRSL